MRIGEGHLGRTHYALIIFFFLSCFSNRSHLTVMFWIFCLLIAFFFATYITLFYNLYIDKAVLQSHDIEKVTNSSDKLS